MTAHRQTASSRLMKAVAIFRSGRHTSAAGAALEFTEAHLAETVAAYDPALHEAPIVVGHPKDNGPAYGWVKTLSFTDGELAADFDQVDPAFAEMVQAGRFKKRSASFYSPTSPSNPVPGVFYLRHVGFLGAQPPAVKGLKEIAFADADEGIVEFADDTLVLSLMARMIRGLRDTLLAKWGQDETEKALPGYLVEDLEAEARRARETPPTDPAMAPAFAEPTPKDPNAMTPEQIAALQAQADKATALEAQVAEFAEAAKKAAHAARVATHTTELNAHVAAGKLLPRLVPQLAEFMARQDEATEVVEFGETDKPRSALALVRDLLDSAPKQIEFREQGTGSPNDSAPKDSQDIANRAKVYRDEQIAKGNHISFTEAVNAIAAQA